MSVTECLCIHENQTLPSLKSTKKYSPTFMILVAQ